MNHLQHEKSPYLLQHAENPVDWYPWGARAFEKAKQEDKPVFLSVGYSTCHWCHVMAHESFEDGRVAEFLNAHFISIKVDREERPDVDAVYMDFCQAMTGSGGWPLTILMTPEQRPFFAGTYLPRESRGGMIGLLDLLHTVAREWAHNRPALLAAGERVVQALDGRREPGPGEPSARMLRQAVSLFGQSYDARWGGFGGAPKFPVPHNLLFLLRYAERERDESCRRMAEHTLEHMAAGGLFDHVGGGFSRYSTDKKWLVPHFEKMLYDNALLAQAYLEAYEQTDRPLFRTAAERTLDYVLRELTAPEGAFYCGQDADSDGVEGKYYVFTPREVREVLGEADGARFCRAFDITERGNFEGKSIPNRIASFAWEADPSLYELCERLYLYRKHRTRLHLDDKILMSWNALMLSALARAHRVLHDERYLEAAWKAQVFLEQCLSQPDGRLYVRWRDGEAAHAGQLSDYAFYALALLDLYEETFSVSFLHRAAALADWMRRLFWDENKGGFFLYASDAEQLIHRPKEVYDGALPSGNSVAALLLGRLARLTGEEKWRGLAQRQLRFVAGQIADYPAAYSVSLLAILEEVSPTEELVCVTADPSLPDDVREKLQSQPLFRPAVLVKTPRNADELACVAPFTKAYPILPSGTRFYLCRGGTCAAPVDNWEDLHL